MTAYTAPAPAPAGTKQKNTVGLIATIVGGVALIFAIIPVLSFIAWLPAIAAIVLGIIGLVQKNRTRGLAWAGLGLGIVSWIIAIVVSIVSVAGLANSVNDAVQEELASSAPAVTAPVEEVEESAPAQEAAPSEAADSPEISVAQQNAARSATNYLSLTAFSRDGLIKQLEFENYSTEDATAAVDSLTVDWNAQAVQKAKEYLEISAFSGQGLLDQLIFEGFTQEQAAQGVAANGL